MDQCSDIPGFSVLLCERCGYVLDDLDPSGECPECGIPIASVQPRLRPGSPWQRQRGLGSMILTWWGLITHPRKCWEQMQVHTASGLSLMGWGLMLGLALPALGIFAAVVIGTIESSDPSAIIAGMFFILIVGGGYLIAALLYAALAVARMKFWARHRSYRIDSRIAWTIIGHASFGLVLAPMLVFVAVLMILTVVVSEMLASRFAGDATGVQLTLFVTSYILILASIPTGLIVFEILSSLGMRRLRYRNLHALEDEQPTPPEPVPPHHTDTTPRTDIT
ncbi:MAG: hypothetical protein ACF8MF_06870 [Phycisphaerales bacterium JB052]